MIVDLPFQRCLLQFLWRVQILNILKFMSSNRWFLLLLWLLLLLLQSCLNELLDLFWLCCRLSHGNITVLSDVSLNLALFFMPTTLPQLYEWFASFLLDEFQAHSFVSGSSHVKLP